MYRQYYLTTTPQTHHHESAAHQLTLNNHKSKRHCKMSQQDLAPYNWKSYKLQPSHLLNQVSLDEEDYLTLCRTVIDPLRQPSNSCRLLLLTGPTGVGKTFLIEALASECSNVLRLPVTELLRPHQQIKDVTQPVRSLFSYAINNKTTCLLALDQMECLLRNQTCKEPNERASKVLREITSCIQAAKIQKSNLVVVIASQEPWLLSRELSSQINATISVQLPDESARKTILVNINESHPKLRLSLPQLTIKQSMEDLFQELAEQTQGFSARQLRCLLEQAANWPVKQMVYDRKRLVTMKQELQFENKDIPNVTHEFKFNFKHKQQVERYTEWKTNDHNEAVP